MVVVGVALGTRPLLVAVEDQQIMSASLIKLLSTGALMRKQLLASQNDVRLFKQDKFLDAIKNILSLLSGENLHQSLALNHKPFNRSHLLFECLLMKKVLLIYFEVLNYFRENGLIQKESVVVLYTAIKAFNLSVASRDSLANTSKKFKHKNKWTISFEDLAEIFSQCRCRIMCWRIEKEGRDGSWWRWAREEEGDMVGFLAELSAHMPALMKKYQSRLLKTAEALEALVWKTTAKKLSLSKHQDALDKLMGKEEWPSSVSPTVLKASWYLNTVSEVRLHSQEAFSGLNNLLVRLSVNSQKSFRSREALVQDILAPSVLQPLHTALTYLKHYSPFSNSPVSNDHITRSHLAMHVDILRASRPLVLLLSHSLWLVARWLSHGLQLSLPTSRMTTTAHLLLGEGVRLLESCTSVLAVAGYVVTAPTMFPCHHPQWLLEEEARQCYSVTYTSHQWIQDQLRQWCEAFFTQWRQSCSLLLAETFPSPISWAKAGKKNTVPDQASEYTSTLLEQLIVPLCEAGSVLSPSSQLALVLTATSLLLLEFRKAILSSKHKLKPNSYCQLQLDYNQMMSHLVSPEGNLLECTQQRLKGLAVCVDITQGLARLTGTAEENRNSEGTPLRFEGELGKLLHPLSVMQEVVWLNEHDWK